MLEVYNNDNNVYRAHRPVKNDNLKKLKPVKNSNAAKSERSAPKRNVKSDLNKLPPLPKDRKVQRNNLKNSAFKVNYRRNLEPIKHIPVDETVLKSRQGWNKIQNGPNINEIGNVVSKTKVKLKHLEPIKVDPKRDVKRKKNRRNASTKIARETAVVYNSSANNGNLKQTNKTGRKTTNDKVKPTNKVKIFIRQETYRVLEPKYVKGPDYNNLLKQKTTKTDIDDAVDKLRMFDLNDDIVVPTYTRDIFGSPVFVSKVYDKSGSWNDLFGKKNVTPPPSYERAMERYDILNRSKLYLNEALRNLDDSHVRLNNIFKNIENTRRRSKGRINRVKSNRLD